MSEREEKEAKKEAQEVKEILSVVSAEVPTLIKGLLASVFSEEAGRNMGKAAAAYYKQLKEGGLPDDVAVRLTEEYMRTFTSLGDMLKGLGKRDWSGKASDTINEEIEKKIRERLGRKREESQGEEE